MSQPEHEGAYLVQRHGHITALEIAARQLDEADSALSNKAYRWHALAVYCYVKGYWEGYCDAPATDLQRRHPSEESYPGCP